MLCARLFQVKSEKYKFERAICIANTIFISSQRRIMQETYIIDQDPRAPRPYLFSDAQNVFDRVVLVCTVSVYILAN